MKHSVFRKPYKHWPGLWRWSLEITVAVMAFLLLSQWVSRHMLDSDSTAPEAHLPTLSGSPVVLQWPSQSSRTLVYFFAPWCGVCKISMPGLNLIPATDTLQVYAIALDYDSASQVQDFVDDIGFNGDVLQGNATLKEQFQIQGYPSYYVLDQNGTILHRDQGLSTPPGLWLRTRHL